MASYRLQPSEGDSHARDRARFARHSPDAHRSEIAEACAGRPTRPPRSSTSPLIRAAFEPLAQLGRGGGWLLGHGEELLASWGLSI